MASSEWQPDVLLERHTLYSDAGWRIATHFGIPWALEVNAPPILERQAFDRLVWLRFSRNWQSSVLQAAPLLLVVSPWLKNWLEEELDCENVVLLPNGAGAEIGDPIRGRMLLGVTDDRPLLGFVGGDKPWVDTTRFNVLARAVGAQVVWIGPLETIPPGWIQRFVHLQQDLADVVSALDVGLALYRKCAPPWFCPLKVQLYRRQGTPVVATSLQDMERWVGEGGTCVPHSDGAAETDAIRNWLGHRCTRSERTWERVAEELDSHLSPLVWPVKGPNEQ